MSENQASHTGKINSSTQHNQPNAVPKPERPAPNHEADWQKKLEEPSRSPRFGKWVGLFSGGALAGEILHSVTHNNPNKKTLLEALKETFSKESYTKEAFAEAWKRDILPELKYAMAGGTVAVALGAVYTWHKSKQSEKSASEAASVATSPKVSQTSKAPEGSFTETEMTRRVTQSPSNQRDI